MALSSGTRLGAYDVVSLLGAGGMGEVYRARDTKLNRDVALKILPEAFALDGDRIARFRREAQVLASLNHPNIAAIYGFEDSGSTHALVLELVEGPTLADRIARGLIRLDEALPIAKQIAEALEAAHEQGIIHRDLKPANIKVRDDGTVKVLDFGLAKALEPASAISPMLTNSPTITTPAQMTGVGTILGTAAYMSPEQARGRPADKRSDVWAFGCVLYEMLTGKRTFPGDDLTVILAAVIKDDPDWSRLPPTSDSLRRMLDRCLDKNPARRLQAIGDARIEIEDAIDGRPSGKTAVAASGPERRGRSSGLLATVAVVAVAAGVIASRFLDSRLTSVSNRETSKVTRTLVSVAPADQLRSNGAIENLGEGRPTRTAMALSPDGRTLVFSAVQGGRQQLYMRALDQLTAAPVPGTEGGASPFFSPSGQWLGFIAGGAIKKVPTNGDAGATTICPVNGTGFGVSWGDDDTIVFAQGGGGVLQVSAAGGQSHEVTRVDRTTEESHRFPQILPGGRAIIFTVLRGAFPKWEDARIVAQSLTTGERRDIAQGADARYVSTGHLVFMRSGALFAAPFDPERLQLTGGAVSVIPDVMQAAYILNASNDTGAGQFSISASGSLAYVPGGMFPDLERALVWLDRSGKAESLAAPLREYFAPRLSPDGKRVLVWTSGRDRNVWVYDLVRGTLTRVTSEGRNSYGVWTPDGRRVVFTSDQAPRSIWWKAFEEPGAAERLLPQDVISGNAQSWTPDGRTLVFSYNTENMPIGIWAVTVNGDRLPRPIVQTKFRNDYPDVSPDGQWIAYASNESGRDEVYVQPFPGPGPRRQISADGGTTPAWARNGRELFYQNRDSNSSEATDFLKYMAVPVTLGGTFSAGAPRLLFQRRTAITFLGTRYYDVAPDGSRFLTVQDKERPPIKVTEMILVQNWFEELKQRVPVK